ncbi:Nibrin, partial [Orchesella cincta]
IFVDTYRKGRKRFIGDSEIGLAAVYNSIEKHCNPKCSLADTVLPQLITQTQSSSGSGSAVIVPPTQDLESQISSTGNTSRSVVNETAVKHDVSDDDRNSTSSERRDKRPLSSSSTSLSGSSSSKKRSAVDALPERQSKRLKEQLSSKQSSQTSNNSNNRSRAALSNLFGMSDSEDEEPVVVPESQPNESLTVHEEPDVVGETQPNESLSDDDDDDELNVVPESQPPLLNIVELRNLQSVMDTQESIIVSGRSRGRRRDDDVFLVPESPPDQSQEGMTRNPGTDHLLTVTESVMNAKTIPSSSFSSVEQDTSPSSSKRLTSQSRRDKKPNDGDGTSRKRQRQEDEEEDLSEHTKKINLDEVKPKIEDSNGELSSTLPLIRLPMVNKNMLRREGSFIEANSEAGRTPVKNFKTFKKVLPSFAAGVTSRSSSILNVTIEDIQSKRPIVKLVNYDYAPGSSVAYIANLPPLVENRDDEPPQDDVQIDTPPTLEEFVPKLLSRRNNRRQPEPAAVEESVSRRRSSPRKKAPAVPAPEASSARANAMEVMDEDEEDDDVWGFKR